MSPTEALCLSLCHSIVGNYCDDYDNGKCRGCDSNCGFLDFDCEARRIACNATKEGEIAAALILTSQIDAIYVNYSRKAPLPLPQWVREKLEPFYNPDVLGEAQVAVYDQDPSDIVLTSLFALSPSVAAVTAGNIIILRRDSDLVYSPSSLALFAHELEHVKQYRDMGRDGFAQVYFFDSCFATYFTDGCRLEQAARDKASLVAEAISKGFSKSSCLPPPPPPPPLTPEQVLLVSAIVADYSLNGPLFGPKISEPLQEEREASGE